MRTVPLSALPTQGLEQPAYVSQATFDREIDRIFTREWQYVGHITQWPSTGKFRRVKLGKHDVILVRDRQGNINGVRNICRHRGAQLLNEPSGDCGRTLTCSYHGWAFGHDGALLGAPKMDIEREFDKSKYGLKPVNVEVWNGLVFVCLNDEGDIPAPVAEQLARVNAEMPYDLTKAKIVYEQEEIIQANWKVSWENGLECYHCAINHPGLATWVDTSAGYRIADGSIPDERFNWFDFPMVEGNQMPDDYLNARPFEGGLSGMKSLTWHPAAWEISLTADFAGIMQHIPISTTETKVVYQMLVPEESEEGVHYDAEKLFGLSLQTRKEDDELCEQIQRGIEAVGYVPGPFNDWYEFEVRRFQRVYRELMGEQPIQAEGLSCESSEQDHEGGNDPYSRLQSVTGAYTP